MDIQKLRNMITISEISSISRAADYLYISQSTLSRQVLEIEDTFKIHIFNRNKSGLRLTPEGQQILPYIRQTVSAYDRMLSAAANFSATTDELLTIGYAFPQSSILTQCLHSFREQVSDVKIHTRLMLFSDMIFDLREGTIDIALLESGNLECLQNIEHTFLAESYIGVIVSKNHRLAKKEKVSLEDIEKENLFAVDRSKGGLILDSKRYIIGNYIPHVQHYFNDVADMLVSVGAGEGIAFFSSLFAGDSFEIVFRPLDCPDEYLQHDVHIAWRKGNQKQLLHQFVSHVQSMSLPGSKT